MRDKTKDELRNEARDVIYKTTNNVKQDTYTG